MLLQQRIRLALQVGLVGIVTVMMTAADGSGVLVLLVWLGIIAAVVIYMRNNRTPYQVQTQTGLPPEEVIRTAVQTFTLAGWQATSQSRDNATFMVSRKGSCLIAFLLLCLGFIPGILYLAFSGRAITANVYARGTEGSRTAVQINTTATGFGGRDPADRVIAALATTPTHNP